MPEFEINTDTPPPKNEVAQTERSFLSVYTMVLLAMTVLTLGVSVWGHVELSSLGDAPNAASIDKTLIVSAISDFLMLEGPNGPEDPENFIRMMGYSLKGFAFVGIVNLVIFLMSLFMRNKKRKS